MRKPSVAIFPGFQVNSIIWLAEQNAFSSGVEQNAREGDVRQNTREGGVEQNYRKPQCRDAVSIVSLPNCRVIGLISKKRRMI